MQTTEDYWGVYFYGSLWEVYNTEAAAKARAAERNASEAFDDEEDSFVAKPLSYLTDAPTKREFWRICDWEDFKVTKDSAVLTDEEWERYVNEREYFTTEAEAEAAVPARRRLRELQEEVRVEFEKAVKVARIARDEKLKALGEVSF